MRLDAVGSVVVRSVVMRYVVLGVLACAIATVGTEAQEPNLVRVATDATWPPMEYIDRHRRLVGFDIDLINEIASRAGFRVEFENVSWEGIFAGLLADRYDMIASSVTILPERAEVMLFSRPYFEAAQYLVVRNERGDVRTLADLTGEEVGAQIATTGARLVDRTPGVTVRSYDDLGLAVEDLAQGRLGGIVADVAIVEYFVLGNDRYGDRLMVVGRPYAIERYGFAIRIDRPDLKAKIDAALGAIERDGTMARLRRRWFEHTGFSTP